MPATRAMLARAKVWKPRFLADYGQHGCVKFAAKKAGVDPKTVYRNLANDAEFRAAVQTLDETDVRDVLVHEAYRRGVEGVLKPVYQGGKRVGAVREFSDTLLTKLLESRVPGFRVDRTKVEVSGADGGPIQTAATVTIMSNVPRPAPAS